MIGISPFVYTANMEKGLPQGPGIGERIFLSDPVHSNPNDTQQRDIDSGAIDSETMRIE